MMMDISALIRAQLLVLLNRTEEYREVCKEILERFGQKGELEDPAMWPASARLRLRRYPIRSGQWNWPREWSQVMPRTGPSTRWGWRTFVRESLMKQHNVFMSRC